MTSTRNDTGRSGSIAPFATPKATSSKASVGNYTQETKGTLRWNELHFQADDLPTLIVSESLICSRFLGKLSPYQLNSLSNINIEQRLSYLQWKWKGIRILSEYCRSNQHLNVTLRFCPVIMTNAMKVIDSWEETQTPSGMILPYGVFSMAFRKRLYTEVYKLTVRKMVAEMAKGWKGFGPDTEPFPENMRFFPKGTLMSVVGTQTLAAAAAAMS